MEPKFNLNRPPVNDEEINSNKDFGELVKKFKQQSIEKARSDDSFLKNKKVTYSSIIAGVAVVCTVTYFSVFKKEPPKQTSNDKIITNQTSGTSSQKNKPAKAFITPPISKLNVPYTSYRVQAEQGATLTHSSKSKIIIPKKAFVNKQGQDIVGDVEIKYREFHNQADIIASGIPMEYDSAGVKSHLESAGMLDIRGYQNGEPVFIKPDKSIKVEFASTQTADKYNMYTLDTVARNWVYTGKDNSLTHSVASIQPAKQSEHLTPTVSSKKTEELQKQIDAILPKIETEKTAYQKKVNQLPKASQPILPNKATPGRPQFQLDVNYKEFPELESFKNAVFEVGAENKNYHTGLTDITWSSADVSEGPQKGKNYLLTLTLRERVEKLIVYPALTGGDYDKALKTYDAKFTDYKTALAKREAAEKKLKEEFEAKQVAFVAEQKKLDEEMIKERVRIRQQQEQQLAEQFSNLSKQQVVTRIFNVSNFGICNSDCPSAMPKGENINPIFVINNGASFITPNNTYLISHSKNVAYNIYPGTPLSYDPKDSYSICVISSSGKMYLCDKESFAKHVVATKQNKVPVTLLSENVNDAHDLRIALGI